MYGLSTRAERSFIIQPVFMIIFEIITFGVICAKETASVVTEAQYSTALVTVSTIFSGIIASMLEVHVSVLYLLVASFITNFYEDVNEEIIAMLKHVGDGDIILTKFEDLRILHANLSDASDYLYEWFGLTSVCIFGTLVTKSLLKVYLITIVYGKISLVKDFSTFIFVSAYLLVLTFASQKLVDSSKRICIIINDVYPIGLSSAFQFQLRLTVLQTTALPVNAMALGLFNTTRSLIPSILSAIAVYITVIVELETPLEMFTIMLNNDSKITVTR